MALDSCKGGYSVMAEIIRNIAANTYNFLLLSLLQRVFAAWLKIFN